MAFSRPTLSELIERARADIQTRLQGTDPWLRWQVEGVLAKVLAGLAHGMHGHLLWLSRQIMPDTAENEFMARWADIYGLTRNDPVAATGPIVISGTPTTVCPAGTTWQRGDGVQYTQDADATIPGGGSIAADVTAVVGGTDGNADAGTTVFLTAPIAGINNSATVDTDGISGGTDLETDAELLARLLLRIRTVPKGGAAGDYVNWALEVSGVTRVWELPAWLGPGTVGVTFVRDNDGVGAAIIPSAGEVTTVQDYLDTKRPVTAAVTVFAPTPVTFNRTMSITPDTAAVRTAIDTELADYLLRVAEPGVTLLLSQINEAISIAAGETDHVLTVPAANVTHAANEIPIDGTTTWT
jgi:uncharacterized phage protein gp47/JayE